MDIKSFIKSFLIDEINQIQVAGHHYISFGLITQGIEFLGMALENNFSDTFVRDKSKVRFETAIKTLFPKKYHQFLSAEKNNFDLYSNLRCGLLHVFLPKSNIELTELKDIKRLGNHLEIKNNRGYDTLILVSENLFEDFKKACLAILKKIDNNEINNIDILAV